MKVTRILIPALLILIAVTSPAQDRSESPYFLVQSETKEGAFPLLSTSADVTIVGPIADVSVLQRYRNDGDQPIEALYVFPASTRAAVYHMEMRIGTRIVVAEVMEKQQATQTYQQAKQEGKRASLLEQSRPNVFQMHVANIMPGEVIDVVMKYTEFIIPESQVYAFVYPTVVGPRYTGSAEQTTSSAFAAMPYGLAKDLPKYTFDIRVHLHMPVPVATVRCSTHQVNIVKQDPHNVSVSLHPSESVGGNRDYIVEYALAGNEIATGILTFQHEKENYFLCQLEAPKLNQKTVIVPREYIFILDVSGSMRGYPLDVSKTLMKNLLAELRPTDKFNVLFFAGSAFMLNHESLDATRENLSYAFEKFNEMRGGGGTELLPALRRALSTQKLDGYARSFVIATDGYVTVEEEAFQLIQQNLDMANFFAFGIGSSVNRHLIEGLAHVGRGEPFIVTSKDDAHAVAEKLRRYIQYPVLTDLCIGAEGVELYDIIPENVPDLLADRPIYFFGKYRGGQAAEISVCGKRGNMEFVTTLEFPDSGTNTSALRYLWAREKIRFLDDFNALGTTSERIDEMVRLGLEYNLLTRYTSFVAVDHEEIVNNGSMPTQVKQPLPMPEGVPNTAVGFELVLEDVVSGAQKNRLLVDVSCDDKDLKLLVESALEIEMQQMSKDELLQFKGLLLRLKISPTGTIKILSAENDLSKRIVQMLTETFRRLRPALKHEHEVNIAVKEILQIK